MNYYKIIVWYNPHKKEYSYKKVKGFAVYHEGYINNYGCRVIMVIDLFDWFSKTKKPPLKTRVIDKFITWLVKLKYSR